MPSERDDGISKLEGESLREGGRQGNGRGAGGPPMKEERAAGKRNVRELMIWSGEANRLEGQRREWVEGKREGGEEERNAWSER